MSDAPPTAPEGRSAFGELNDHSIGIVMREAVRRAIAVIRDQLNEFEIHEKEGLDHRPDLVTSADHAAQQIYVEILRECFPQFGIVAEEDHLDVPCRHPHRDLWFTVDPLDGTRAFVRRQSQGIGTMIGLVEGDEVIAAYVGDVNTREIYGYRPGSGKVHRLREFRLSTDLGHYVPVPLDQGYCLITRRPERYSPGAQRFLATPEAGGPLRGIIVTGGSIGLCMARVWKGEVTAMLIHAGKKTPWDTTPMLGIMKRLGFAALAVDPDSGRLRRTDLRPQKTLLDLPHDTVVLHDSYLEQLGDWLER